MGHRVAREEFRTDLPVELQYAFVANEELAERR
jgi:hypothetical protein